MPLDKSGSPGAFKTNVKTLMDDVGKSPHVQSRKQALAIAYATARRYGKAAGGTADESFVRKGSSIKLGREGMLNSSIPGRTDKLPMSVKAGSYVLPADIPSALGQGNTMAGGEILKKMFNSGPYGLPLPKGGGKGGSSGRMKKMFAEGGEAAPDENGEGDHVPIVAAGGEYIIPPEVVQDIGHGNMKAGHNVLDKFVLRVRKHHIATLKKLPGPKK